MAERERIEVISSSYRFTHTLNLFLYTMLIITGLMLFSIDLTAWLAYSVGSPLATGIPTTEPIAQGVQWARAWHRFLGHVWGALIIIYPLYLVITRRLTTFIPLKKGLRKQIREAVAVSKYYLLGKPLPEDIANNMDRHNILVAHTAILLVVSSILLSVSGLAMVYRDAIGLDLEGFRLMLLLHDVGFGMGVLYVLLHIFAVLDPMNRPLLLAMFGDGRVSLRWARNHMPKFVEKFLKKKEEEERIQEQLHM
ncbi:MAG TPA: cytochrome b/b6 domain-containing protein [Candidatus Caldiarchaeum subterraneum]|uniref:Cytochrome b/b6 domain-containing protein n=1 Tax=Caldiarchaeum subterraneum TaxID=311458 RepID=A0A833A3A8_CALS0|nr:cytochrome b/b6 domain-containing protein [Candidatus Caldarchaeum subterraneum]